MSKVELIARAEIVGLRESHMIATGKARPGGEPVFERRSEAIRPGERFICTSEQAHRLLVARAAVPVGGEEADFLIRKAIKEAT